MNTEQAYNQWSSQYDTNVNKTRDLEGLALQQVLDGLSFHKVLELGCGTGKNTAYLVEKAHQIVAVDLSEEMLNKARTKVNSPKVQFIRADLNQGWTFTDTANDLVTFSLVLEHISDLEPIFRKVADSLVPGGLVYIGELHPFKQYSGSKARFDTGSGLQVVPCFTHHITDFTNAAQKHGLEILSLGEHFDDDDRSSIPRILTLLLKKRI
jgi:predicted TPR repeat methyltransferase